MKRHLYFLRHAVAEDRENWQGKDDGLRPLVKQGILETQRMAKHLKRLRLDIDRIITSPLVRSRDSAGIVGDLLNVEIIVDDLLRPGCGIPALKKLLEKYEAKNLMLVGHEPDFSGMITAVINGGNIKVKKGALACIALEDVRKPSGVLRWLLTPELITD